MLIKYVKIKIIFND